MRLSIDEFAALFPNHPTTRDLRTNGQLKGKKSSAKKPKHSRKGNTPAGPSSLEQLLLMHLKAENLTAGLAQEYAFHPERKWRMDFAWPENKIAIEVEGGVWTQGRHTRPQGFINDTHKYNQAAILGWTVLRFTEQCIKSGEAIKSIKSLLDG